MDPKERILVRQKSCGTIVSIQRRWFNSEHYEKLDQPKSEAKPQPEPQPEPEVELEGFTCGPCGKTYKTMPALKAHKTRDHQND